MIVIVSSVPAETAFSVNALTTAGGVPGDGAVVRNTNGDAYGLKGTLNFGASVARYQPPGAPISRSSPGSCELTSNVAVDEPGSIRTRAARRCGCAKVYAGAAYASTEVTATTKSKKALTSDGRRIGLVAETLAMNGGATINAAAIRMAPYTQTGVITGKRPNSATTNASRSATSCSQSVPATASTTIDTMRTAWMLATGTASNSAPAARSGSVQR